MTKKFIFLVAGAFALGAAANAADSIGDLTNPVKVCEIHYASAEQAAGEYMGWVALENAPETETVYQQIYYAEKGTQMLMRIQMHINLLEISGCPVFPVISFSMSE